MDAIDITIFIIYMIYSVGFILYFLNKGNTN